MLRRFLLLLFLITLCPVAWGQKDDVYEERELKEVLVKPKRQRYKRKGNPAVELMRKVIAAKADHNLENNDYFRYNKYQRITTAFDNITQEMIDSVKILQKPLIRRQVEFCEQTGNTSSPSITPRRSPSTCGDAIPSWNAIIPSAPIPKASLICCQLARTSTR